jgi:hypothetical protein
MCNIVMLYISRILIKNNNFYFNILICEFVICDLWFILFYFITYNL